MTDIKIIECPRDAMQGLSWFVPTADKIDYLNLLLKAGFHTIDCGSFVSPQYIPQMRDTAEVLQSVDRTGSDSQLSVIVANVRGAKDAAAMSQVDHIGFPFSVSEQFQWRNTRKSVAESFEAVRDIQEICSLNNKEMVVYISMGFGNPYGDEWNENIVRDWVGKISQLNVKYFSLSDTVGVSDPEKIELLFGRLIPDFPQLEFGAHFHTRPDQWFEKVDTAYRFGCRRFDGCLKGYGGCPMAKDELVGNMPTENLLSYFEERGVQTGINKNRLFACEDMASKIFLA